MVGGYLSGLGEQVKTIINGKIKAADSYFTDKFDFTYHAKPLSNMGYIICLDGRPIGYDNEKPSLSKLVIKTQGDKLNVEYKSNVNPLVPSTAYTQQEAPRKMIGEDVGKLISPEEIKETLLINDIARTIAKGRHYSFKGRMPDELKGHKLTYVHNMDEGRGLRIPFTNGYLFSTFDIRSYNLKRAVSRYMSSLYYKIKDYLYLNTIQKTAGDAASRQEMVSNHIKNHFGEETKKLLEEAVRKVTGKKAADNYEYALAA